MPLFPGPPNARSNLILLLLFYPKKNGEKKINMGNQKTNQKIVSGTSIRRSSSKISNLLWVGEQVVKGMNF